MPSYQNRNFGWGYNVLDSEHQIDDPYAVIAKNVIVGGGFVEQRGGYELWNEDASRTGGIPMMVPAYFRDGTNQLVFANDDDYFFLANTAVPADSWGDIGDYGTAVPNPFGYMHKNHIVFGTGVEANTSYKYDAVTESVLASTIAFVDSNPDTITDSGNGLGSFRVGDILTVSGSASNDGIYTIAGVAAGTLTLIGGDTLAVESAGASVRLSTTGFSIQTVAADTSSDIRFFEYHQGKNSAALYGGGNVKDDATDNRDRLYYTPDSDDWSTGGAIPIGDGDGQTLTGVASHSNIIAFKDGSKYRLDVVYESNSGTNVIRVLERFNDSGSINHECIVEALNDIVTLSGRKGDGVRGFSQVQTNLGGSESKKYSTKVTPLFDQINRTHAKNTIRSIIYNEKILMAAPLGGSATNNVIFVGHLDQPTNLGEPAWTIFDINAGSFAILRDGNDEDILLIGDSNSPKIYKWNPNLLTDNGFPITSQFRTKKFDGGSIAVDEFETVVIAGEMTSQTELLVKVIIDGNTAQYRITKEQILGTGNLVWSHIIGSEVVGGKSTGTGFTKRRFVALLSIPDELREGSEIQIDLSASGKGYWWKMDYLGILEQDQKLFNLNLFPDNHWVDTK